MRYTNGLFGWVDVMTRDPRRATEFYEGLFGWTHTDQPTPMGPPYTQFFKDGKLVEKPQVTMYFNGIKVHTNQTINQVWGGPNSGLDGGNDGGKGITDTPGGLKLQAEGHDVRYRNAWIKELDLKELRTDF